MSDEVRGLEELIKEALDKGEFDDLPGKGKPLDLNAYFQTPEDLRMGFSVLKSSNFGPQEGQILKDMEALREQIRSCLDEERKKELSKALNEKSLSYSLLIERLKKTK